MGLVGCRCSRSIHEQVKNVVIKHSSITLDHTNSHITCITPCPDYSNPLLFLVSAGVCVCVYDLDMSLSLRECTALSSLVHPND